MWGLKCVSVWVPVVETNEKNSTLAFIKGAHKTGKTARHTFDSVNAWYTDLSIDEMRKTLLNNCTKEEFDKRVTIVNCMPGDILIFPGVTPHRSLSNNTDLTRWSLDFRYHPADTPNRKNPLDWFYGVKDSLPLNKEGDSEFKPDWGKWS